MKTFKKFTAGLVSTLIALSTISAIGTTAFAEKEMYLKSVFTPYRSCVDFEEGMDGFNYPTFNNFCDNPNLINNEGKSAHATYQESTTTQLTKGDERVFTTGVNWTKCEGDECYYYGNSVGEVEPLNYGEIVSFSIYFHNNGSDPYDNTNPNTSPNAEYARIGIDVSNIHTLHPSDPYPNLVRPRGYIEADNNAYPNATPAFSTDAKATDDLPIFYNPTYDKDDVEMEVIPGSAYLVMNEEDPSDATHATAPDFSKEITKTEMVTFTTDDGDKTIEVKPYISQDKKKIWLRFSELPGCFRYSGFAYFQARLVPPPPEQPNFCTSLELETTPITIYAATKDDKLQTPLCTPEQKTTKFEVNVNFNEGNPEEGYVTLSTTDLQGTIYLDGASQSEAITEFPATVKLSDGKVSGTYTGLGQLAAVFTDENGDPGVYVDHNGNIMETDDKSAPSSCQDIIPTCEDDCKDICVERPKEMTEGTYFPMNAEAVGFYDTTWGKVKYTAEYEYAEIFKGTEEEIVKKIKDKYGVDPVKNTSFMLGCDPIFINLLNAGDVMTGIINAVMNYDSIAKPQIAKPQGERETDDKLLPAYDESKTDGSGRDSSDEENSSLFLPNFQFYMDPAVLKTVANMEPTPVVIPDPQSFYEVPEDPTLGILPDEGDPSPIKIFKPQYLQNNVLLAFTPIDLTVGGENNVGLFFTNYTKVLNGMIDDYQTAPANPATPEDTRGTNEIDFNLTEVEKSTVELDYEIQNDTPITIDTSTLIDSEQTAPANPEDTEGDGSASIYQIDPSSMLLDLDPDQLKPATELETIPESLLDYQMVIAEPGETVWVYAKKAGEDKIKVTTTKSTENENCTDEFDIIEAPALVCKSIDVSAKLMSDGSKITCVDKDEAVAFEVSNIKLEDKNGNEVDAKNHNFEYRWVGKDGMFKYIAGGDLLKETPSPFYTQLENVMYLGLGPVNMEMMSIDGNDLTDTPCKLTLPACEEVACKDLSLTFDDGTKSALIGGIEEFHIKIISDKDEDYPSTIKWVDETQGKIIFPKFTQVEQESSTVVIDGVEKELTTYTTSYPITGSYPKLVDSQVPGLITVSVIGEEGVCSDSVSIEEESQCLLLNYTVYNRDGSLASFREKNPTLLGTEQYKISSNVKYSKDKTIKTVTYESHEGYFAMEKPFKEMLPAEEKMPKENLSETPPEEVIAPESDALEEEPFMDSEVIAPVAPVAPSEMDRSETPPEETRVVAPKAPSRTVAEITTEAPEDSFMDSEVIAPAAPAAPLVNRLLKIYERIYIPDPDLTKWSSKLENVPVNAKVLFTPKSDLEAGKTYSRAIKIQATGSDPLAEPECTQYISLVIPAEEDACQNITVKAAPWPFDSTAEKTKIFIDESASDFGDYKGNFTFNLALSYDAKLFVDENLQDIPKSEIIVTQEQAKNGIYLGPTEKAWAVAIKATDETPSACLQTIEYEPEIIPPEETFCDTLTITEPSTWVFDPEEDEQEFEVMVTPGNYPFVMEWSVDQGSNGDANFEHGSSTSLKNTLKNLSTAVESITVKVKEDQTDSASECEDTISMGNPSGTITPPSIKKRVRTEDLNDNNDDWDDLLNIDEDEDYLTYRVVYKPGTDDSVKKHSLRDTGFENNHTIRGSRDGEFVYDEDDDNFEIDIDRKSGLSTLHKDDLYECDDQDHEDDIEEYGICIKHDDAEDLMDKYTSGDWVDFIITDIDNIYKITIYYEVENNTNITEKSCKEMEADDGCGEEFENEVEFKAGDYDGDDDTAVIVVCPYILTSTSGDVFFNSALDTGTDVSYCSPQKNVQGPIIKPLIPAPDQDLPSTGGGTPADTLLKLPQHDVCKFSNLDVNLDGYENPFENFSSTICEMEAEVAEDWMTVNVVNQINSNIEKLSKWSNEIYGPLTSMNSLTSSGSNASQGVFRANSDLTINGESTGYVIKKQGTIPAAQTYIVKGADLYIKSNIVYGQTDYSDQNAIPAAAFVVIDGNIIIDKDVEKLYGTYIAIDTNPNDENKTGQVIANGGESKVQLTFYGSLIGDVTDLFTNRKYVGDISSEGGAVTVKQTADFFLNTPPGLNELMDVTQLEVAY